MNIHFEYRFSSDLVKLAFNIVWTRARVIIVIDAQLFMAIAESDPIKPSLFDNIIFDIVATRTRLF